MKHLFLALLFLPLCSLSVLAQNDVEPTTQETTEQLASKEAEIEIVNNVPEFWLAKLQTALTSSNFDAGIVSTKANKTESYKWVHGVVEGKEVETIAPLIGGGVSTIRQGNTVAFIEPNKPIYSIIASSIRNFIPPIFYQQTNVLKSSYQFVLVSKNQVGGRAAQLIRIESIDNTAYNMWLWLDIETGLPLRIDYINKKGEVIERVLMTHLTVFSGPTEDIHKMSVIKLPVPSNVAIASTQDTNNWRMGWIPAGFKLVKSDRHHVSMTREVSDYYLFSDGLFEFSIYIQRPLESYESPLLLNEGATSFVMLNAGGFDVTVVGAIPVETAYKVATNIKRN